VITDPHTHGQPCRFLESLEDVPDYAVSWRHMSRPRANVDQDVVFIPNELTERIDWLASGLLLLEALHDDRRGRGGRLQLNSSCPA
jgi:hypothetical protein